MHFCVYVCLGALLRVQVNTSVTHCLFFAQCGERIFFLCSRILVVQTLTYTFTPSQPNIRYCAYSLGDSGAIEEILRMDNLDQLLQSKLDVCVARSFLSLFPPLQKDRFTRFEAMEMISTTC